jgi:hypothetical protein
MEDFTVNKKTKTEYIKTNKEIWDLKEEFKAGMVYWDCRDDMGIIKADNNTNFRALLVHDLYIKTEVEIPWYERLDDFSYPLLVVHRRQEGIMLHKLISANSAGDICKQDWRPATKAEIQVLLDNAPEV